MFGSFGVKDSAPIVLLNGVYMMGKTDAAAQSIANTIENDFSRPLGCSMQLIASQYGGSSRYGKDYSNRQVKVKRLRALEGYNGEPENEIYDDLGVGINEDATTSGHVWHKSLK